MHFRHSQSTFFTFYTLLFFLLAGVNATDILQTNGFSTCGTTSDIQVQKMNIQYDRTVQKVTFDVAGTSLKVQKVNASLLVYAYGKQVYQKDFDPCSNSTFVKQLCPVPKGTFAAAGEQAIPAAYASLIPAIAFDVPDLDGTAKLELRSLDTGDDVACIQSVVDNGKTTSTTAVPVIAAGIAGAALLVSGLSAAVGAGLGGGVATAAPSPTFLEVMGWFQGLAMNGMMSVQYPSVYRSFTKNFGFSTGLIPWDTMQTAIDNFRGATGGNLTEDSVAYLRNATLVYDPSANITKRDVSFHELLTRAIITSVNADTTTNTTAESSPMHTVHGIEAYVEQFAIPQANTFMTILLVFAIIVGVIIVGILLFKLILELWCTFGTLGKTLNGFRKRYWWIMAKTITNLILLLYGVWTLYCVFQFTHGDSWAVKALAGVTLTIFTAILAYFTFRIWSLARQFKKSEGDSSALFNNKETWLKYSLFYENYKKGYWWLFIPSIVYMFAKGVIIAAGDGHGMFQTGGQLIVESVMLILLLWARPFGRKSGNWINIIIQIVRVLSVLCIIVFVEQLGISQTPKTVVGLALIIVQSVLTGVLAILIGVNAIISCFRANPHRKARKAAEKANADDLTPLDARDSMLYPPGFEKKNKEPFVHVSPTHSRDGSDSSDHFSYKGSYVDEETGYLPAHRQFDDRFTVGRGISPNPSMRAPLLRRQ